MAFSSRAEYTATGATDIFALPFDYLDRTHISVIIDGVSVAFTFVSDTSLQITAGNPAANASVVIKRTTPSNLVQYSSGSTLDDVTLNTMRLAAEYIEAEHAESSLAFFSVEVDGAGIAVSDSTDRIVVFADTDGDEEDVFDHATDLFTAVDGGIYHFDVGLQISGSTANTAWSLSIRKNGVRVGAALVTEVADLSAPHAMNLSRTMRLEIGDTIEIRFQRISIGGTCTIGGESWFTGARLS